MLMRGELRQHQEISSQKTMMSLLRLPQLRHATLDFQAFFFLIETPLLKKERGKREKEKEKGGKREEEKGEIFYSMFLKTVFVVRTGHLSRPQTHLDGRKMLPKNLLLIRSPGILGHVLLIFMSLI